MANQTPLRFHPYLLILTISAAAAFAAPGAAAPRQGSRAPETHCILHAKIHNGDGNVIENGRVVVRDGRIEIVDSGAEAPPGARVIDGTGLMIYPGFIDGSVAAGIAPPAIVHEGPNRDPGAEASAKMQDSHRKGIRPDASGLNLLDITEEIAGGRRQAGFAAALFEPSAATIGGRAALADLSGGRRRDVLLRIDVAMAAELRPAPSEGYPVSAMGAVALFRQSLLDADWYQKSWKAWREHSKQMTVPATDEILASLEPVLDRAMPVAFEANTSTQILRALKAAEEFNIQPWIVGGAEAWKCTDALLAKRVPVLLSLDFGAEPKDPPAADTKKTPESKPASAPASAPASGPASVSASAPASGPAAQSYKWPDPDEMSAKMRAERKRLYEEKVNNAVAVAKAGVPFLFTTRGLKSAIELHALIAKLVEKGLTREQALAALTTTPAELFGVSEILGKIETGRPAYLTITKGAPGDKEFKIRYVFIQKKRFDFDEEGASAAPASQPAGGGGRRRPRADADHDDGGGASLDTFNSKSEKGGN
ncbi:MAG: amidohydrolase family protein [Planctomycetes bacterium]|nr:amidohydrolase family protein [Planctomycetota bacterium]